MSRFRFNYLIMLLKTSIDDLVKNINFILIIMLMKHKWHRVINSLHLMVPSLFLLTNLFIENHIV